MSVYQPVCTCAVPGITGCAKHPPQDNYAIAVAEHIVAGHAFTDQDAITVAKAYLHRKENP